MGCVLLLPALMLYASGAQLSWISYAAMIPMMLLLAIGGFYWRAKYQQLTKSNYNPLPLFQTIRKLKPVALIFTIAALAVIIWAWLDQSISIGLNDLLPATVAAVLALAEYVNYYHRPLQHFDNIADFKRLLQGKGFRKSQLAMDLEAIE